jgi:phosphotransferase system HPr-like phosphotransfer protein
MHMHSGDSVTVVTDGNDESVAAEEIARYLGGE